MSVLQLLVSRLRKRHGPDKQCILIFFPLNKSSFSTKPYMTLITKRSILDITILACCSWLLARPYGISLSPTLSSTLWIIFSSCHFIFETFQSQPFVIYLIKWANAYYTKNQALKLWRPLIHPLLAHFSISLFTVLLQESRFQEITRSVLSAVHLSSHEWKPFESRDFCQSYSVSAETVLGTYKCSIHIHLLNKENRCSINDRYYYYYDTITSIATNTTK